MQYDRSAIAEGGITRVINYAGRRRGRVQYVVEFDPSGRPMVLREGRATAKRWDHSVPAEEQFGRKWIGTRYVVVRYDTIGRMIQLKELQWYDDFSRMELMMSIAYDDETGHFTQRTEDRTIYRPGFQYRGTKYVNDTSVTTLSHAYDEVGNGDPITGDTTITIAMRYGSARSPQGCFPLYAGDSTRQVFEDGRLTHIYDLDRNGAITWHRSFTYRPDGLVDAQYDGKGSRMQRWEYVYHVRAAGLHPVE